VADERGGWWRTAIIGSVRPSKRARGVRAAGVRLSAGAALIACVVSGWPQSVAAAGQGPAVSLIISPAVQSHLLRLYAAYRQLPVTSVAPAPPGRVLGARLPSSGTDWALVHVEPSARAGRQAAAGFQDGAGTGIFTRPPGGAWTVAGLGGQPSGCAVSLPRAVRRLWHLPGCRGLGGQPAPRPPGPVTAGTPAGLVTIALAQVGVADNPPVTSFNGLDCNPYTTLVGNPLGAPGRHCKTSSNGSYFQNVPDVSEFWCADFTKWVWEKAGVTSKLGTLTPSAASFYTWGAEHGEHISFGGTPQAGDAVVLYPPSAKAPNGSYADHVGIVTAVHADGTVNLVNGDFLGPANISVRYNTDVHL
jgi:CHAP domain-containing protein